MLGSKTLTKDFFFSAIRKLNINQHYWTKAWQNPCCRSRKIFTQKIKLLETSIWSVLQSWMPLVLCKQFGIQKKYISYSKHLLSVLFDFSYLPFVLLPSENQDLSVSRWAAKVALEHVDQSILAIQVGAYVCLLLEQHLNDFSADCLWTTGK